MRHTELLILVAVAVIGLAGVINVNYNEASSPTGLAFPTAVNSQITDVSTRHHGRVVQAPAAVERAVKHYHIHHHTYHNAPIEAIQPELVNGAVIDASTTVNPQVTDSVTTTNVKREQHHQTHRYYNREFFHKESSAPVQKYKAGAEGSGDMARIVREYHQSQLAVLNQEDMPSDLEQGLYEAEHIPQFRFDAQKLPRGVQYRVHHHVHHHYGRIPTPVNAATVSEQITDSITQADATPTTVNPMITDAVTQADTGTPTTVNPMITDAVDEDKVPRWIS